ncbi:IS66 family transposase [Acidomonas methanolica]|uniref:IS66 family transposase n=1 Tax=Acidomonas methanolica TaxID=437 RepID=UPI00351CE8D4|nr:transposase [Acidomonas methanolica]
MAGISSTAPRTSCSSADRAPARPILKDFHDSAIAQKPRVSRKDGLGRAFHYALVRWGRLCAYTQDGRLSIDNTFSERCLRNIAGTRKNFLFLGSDRLARGHPINRLDELLPWHGSAGSEPLSA